LKGIADTMGSLNTTNTTATDGFRKLKDTIRKLNNTAHAEDIELEKEEDEVAKLNATIANFVCDCTYNSWGNWGSCSKTCEPDGMKDRSRTVKWYPRNDGMACIESDKQDSTSCNKDVCCPVPCTWGEWTEWSDCPDKCGTSKVFRTREKNEHKCGGTPCSGLGKEEQECNIFSELKTKLVNARNEISQLKEKMCQNVICNNGGICQEGECICTDGFSGSTCEDKGIEKSYLVKTYTNFGPDFTITFDMKITKLPVGWHNILHLTTGGSCCGAGSRIPGLWLNYKYGKPYLHAAIAMIRSQIYKDITLEIDKQYSVELVQAAGFYSVKINGKQVWRVHSGSATFQNVKYYWSDPWSPSAGDVAILSMPIIRQGNRS